MLGLVIPWWGRWVALAIALVAAAAFGAAKMHAWDQNRYDALRGQFEKFKDQAEALGLQAKKDAKAKEASDKERKANADKENAAALAALAGTVRRLRAQRAHSNIVPAAPATAARPELATFDRAELERALRVFTSEVQGIADEGSAATVNLDSAKRWAQGK